MWSSKGVFAYHIATLIVVDEIPNKEDPSIKTKVSTSYPIVDYGDGSPEGDVWMFSDVKNCRVVCRENENGRYQSIPLAWFSSLLQFNQGTDIIKVGDDFYPLTPGVLHLCLNRFAISVGIPDFNMAEYDVELKFRQDKDRTIFESVKGYLYFTSSFSNDPMDDKSESYAMDEIISWWDEYKLFICPLMHENQYLGLVFRTDDDSYGDFVAELNRKIEEHDKQK